MTAYGDIFMSDMTFVLALAGPAPISFDAIPISMNCRVGDQGVRTIVQVIDSAGQPVNLRDATKLLIKFLKPSGDTYDAIASFLTNGFDGRIYFTSTSGAPPFDEFGTWFVQVEAAINSVQQSTKWGSFNVEQNIDAA